MRLRRFCSSVPDFVVLLPLHPLLETPEWGLLMLPDTTPAHKGLAPSGKLHLLFATYSKFTFKFGTFQELATSARCSCRGHTPAKPQ